MLANLKDSNKLDLASINPNYITIYFPQKFKTRDYFYGFVWAIEVVAKL